MILDELNMKESEDINKKVFISKLSGDNMTTELIGANFNIMRDTIVKHKYGIINGHLYFLDTERDELLKFEDFIKNKTALKRAIQNKSHDAQLIKSLENYAKKSAAASAKTDSNNNYDNSNMLLIKEIKEDLEA